MPAGTVQACRRALVKALLAVALVYNVVLTVARESLDADVVKTYKRVVAV